jgi:peptide/nickel transport system permease protein
MSRYVIRRLAFTLLTMLLVTLAIFLISEVAPGDVARHILGQFATEEQVMLLREQMGLNQPIMIRFADWLIGSDWRVSRLAGKPLKLIKVPGQDDATWWAIAADGTPKQWKMKNKVLVEVQLQSDGKKLEVPFDGWQTDKDGSKFFWGVDTAAHVVLWRQGGTERKAGAASAGRTATESSGERYYPIGKGLLRGDAGISLRTNKPVWPTLTRRIGNSIVLALLAFAFIMPIALFLGIWAGLKEGHPADRTISIFGLITTSVPEFASGVFLILVFAFWLKILPGAAVYKSDIAPWQDPKLLILPVLTLTLVEIGYIARITRASMIEVMNAPYIRTAYLKGLPYKRIVTKHALRNALMAPITVIMLHVNWLIGGIVVVESVYGYPGLGMYLLDSSLFKDVNAIMAGALFMVMLAVATQWIADIIYTFLNPRIRYS